MFKVAEEKLNLEQQVTGGGNGIIILDNIVKILFTELSYYFFF